MLPGLALRSVKTCPFCTGLLNGSRDVLARRGGLVLIESRFKVARRHALILPWAHVEHEMGLKDELLLIEVRDWARDLAYERCVVHPPPFNSVNHFHVHCLDPPFTNTYRDWAHSGLPPFSFTVDQCIKRARPPK